MTTDAAIASISIDPRFCGPPASGNGGYVCGRVARFVEGPARVRLHVPPPLARPLSLHPSAQGLELRDGDTPVAIASPVTLDLEPPAVPDFERARSASRRFRGFERHAYPSCFVCGPARAQGDGLRIFTGALDASGVFAAPWIPDATLSLPDAGGAVAPEFLWSALDCPGGFAFVWPEGCAILLGELAARLIAPVTVGERCVLAAWEIEHAGRKHVTGSALYGEDGACRAVARGVWLEVPEPDAAPGGADG
jgi:hypothetical protein